MYNITYNRENCTKRRNSAALKTGVALSAAVPVWRYCKLIKLITPQQAELSGENIQKICPDIDSFENVKFLADKVISEKGLDKKGVMMRVLGDEKQEASTSPNKTNTSKNPPPKRTLWGKIVYSSERRLLQNLYTELKSGMNAVYSYKSKKVIFTKKRHYSAVFHELGHAMNANDNIFIRSIAKTSHKLLPYQMSIIAPIALAAKMINPKNSDDDRKAVKSTKDAVKFMGNNVAALTAASYIPLLTEEFLASYRGVSAVKKHLPKEKYTQLVKNYKVAFCTYLNFTAKITLLSAAIAAAIDLIRYGLPKIEKIDKNKKQNDGKNSAIL